MKKMIAFAFVAMQIAAVSAAHADIADELYTVVQCTSQSIMLSHNVQVEIKEGGFSGVTLATVTLQNGPAPARTLGPISVRQKPVQPGVDGAPLVYVGQDFELSVNVDGAPTPRGQYSHLTAEVDGERVNEPMMCQLLAHPL
jgi:hypothetical protein